MSWTSVRQRHSSLWRHLRDDLSRAREADLSLRERGWRVGFALADYVYGWGSASFLEESDQKFVDDWEHQHDDPFWVQLARFQPSVELVDELWKRRFEVQYIEESLSRENREFVRDTVGYVNHDFYPVRVARMPSLGGAALTPAQLLHHIRVHLNDFIDSRYARFTCMDREVDGPRWNAPVALGAVIKIDCKMWWITDHAGVVVSAHCPQGWIFTTLKGPRGSGPGTHPVSGNRQFGFRPDADGGSWFFTRGLDRVTGGTRILGSALAFRVADRLWKSFQRKVCSFVNEHGGSAQVVRRISKRLPPSTLNEYITMWSSEAVVRYHPPPVEGACATASARVRGGYSRRAPPQRGTP